MREIKGLIKKDLYNLASYKTSLIIVIIGCGLAFFSGNMTNYVPIIMCMIAGMISLSTFNYDDLAKSDKYILSLPVSKKEIVMSKYILAIGATIIGGGLGFLFTILVANGMNYIRTDSVIAINYEQLLTTTIGGMFGIALVQAIQIPSIYKWGAEKGRIQMFILLFGLVAIIGIIGFFIIKINPNFNLHAIESFLQSFGFIILIAIIGIMYYTSYKIAYKIYLHKDK